MEVTKSTWLEKNEKQLVNEYCQREKLANPVYACTPDQEKNPNGFFCTLSMGSQSFCTPNWEKTKKLAVLEAAKLAVKKFNLTQQSAAEGKQSRLALVKNGLDGAKQTPVNNGRPAKAPKGDHPATKEAEWITIEKVEDIYQYLTDEVLAQEFKAFLHCKAQEEKKTYPVFTTYDVGEKGYTATVTYDDKQYKSVGIMLSKKQAEQSASEVCLRSLGDFPAVSEDKYTIQPYRGGRVSLVLKGRGARNAGNKDVPLLHFIVTNIGLQHPQYLSKEVVDDTTSHKAVCWFEGKTFESAVCATPSEAKQSAASEAIKFLGITDPERAVELKDQIRIRRRRTHIALGTLMSPLTFCPSKREAWIYYHFEPLDEYKGGEELDYATLSGIIDLNTRGRLPSQTIDTVLDKVFTDPPSLCGKLVSATTDLAVAEIDAEDQNLMLLGNNQYSIRMYCEGGKIRCTKRSCDVELLPGHNIRGLKCSYKITLPALQVYLKAESCTDLFYPNPALPVVTACGVAILMYDHEANMQDLHILLTRPSSNKTFISKAKSLASYLNKLIGATPLAKFSASECVSTINAWSHNEIKLLSEMTMDSMLELMSPFVTYDDRWNEIFAKEHPDGLKELKDAAAAELERREEEGVTEGEQETGEWMLPNVPFRHRLIPTGVLFEDNIKCTFRSVLERSGLRVKLSELEASPHVDMPFDENPNAHRGDVHRYYLWNGLRKVSKGETEPYYKGADILEKLGEGWIADEERSQARKRIGKARERARQKRKAQEGSETESKKSVPEGEEEVKVEEKAEEATTEPAPEDAVDEEKIEAETERDLRPVSVEPVKDTMTVHEECRWFTLEEARKVCTVLDTLSETAEFQAQVKSLQRDANAFVKEKAASVS